MIVILKDIDDYVFSSALKTLQFSTTEDSANVCIKKGTEIILDEKYIPDASGNITIYDLNDLISPYISDNHAECSFKITDNNDEKEFSVIVQQCAVDINLSYIDFVKNYFLTLLVGSKETALECIEFLYFIPKEECSLIVSCTYIDEYNNISTRIFRGNTYKPSDKIERIDVSPNKYLIPYKELISYTVAVGLRHLSFNVSNCFDAEPSLFFINSFGCRETFYCWGTQSLEPEFSRDMAYINGMYRNYFQEEDRFYKANTGVLSDAMMSLADDLIRSKEIFLIEGEKIGKEITITESETKRSNDYDNLPSFNFTYRYSQKNQLVAHFQLGFSVFDETFDNTFK